MPGAAVMTWKLLPGFIALMKSLRQLNVPGRAGELSTGSMATNVNCVAIFDSLDSSNPDRLRVGHYYLAPFQ